MGMIAVLCDLRSALNVGSIVRTCDALGVKTVYGCGITPNPKNPKVSKTSLGAEKHVKWKEFPRSIDAILELRDRGYSIIGLETGRESVPLTTFHTKKEKIALILGNEVSGIADDIKKQCDTLLEIPMQGMKESLNVSIAFGIAAFWFSIDL